jgi:hypothetical protein
MGTDSVIYEYDLSTNFDISTYSYSGNSISSGATTAGTPYHFDLDDSGTYLSIYCISSTVADQEISIWSGAVDPYYDNVLLLLKFDGTNGATTTTDSSSYTHTVTVVGDADIDTSAYKFGGSSTYIDDTINDSGWSAVGTPLNQHDAEDWTVEFWVNIGTAQASEKPCFESDGIEIGIDNLGKVQTRCYSPTLGTKTSSSASNAVTVAGGWHHVALARDGQYVYCYVNGVSVATTDLVSPSALIGDGTDGTSQTVTIGHDAGGGMDDAFIDDFRWTHGVCRYPGGVSFATTPVIAAPTSFPTWKRYQG